MLRTLFAAALLAVSASPALAQSLEGTGALRVFGGFTAPDATFDRATDVDGAALVGVSLSAWQTDHVGVYIAGSRSAGSLGASRVVTSIGGTEPGVWLVDLGGMVRSPVALMDGAVLPYATVGGGFALYTGTEAGRTHLSATGALGATWDLGAYGLNAEVKHWLGSRIDEEGGRLAHTNVTIGLSLPLR